MCNCVTALNLERQIVRLEDEIDRAREITSEAIDAKYAVLQELKAARKHIEGLETQIAYLQPGRPQFKT